MYLLSKQEAASMRLRRVLFVYLPSILLFIIALDATRFHTMPATSPTADDLRRTNVLLYASPMEKV